VWAQATNLEAGKSASQIFSGSCTACHKSPRGLLKTVAPGSLTGFLKQHYTTSPDMAGALSAYLISNGASDTRGQPKQDGRQPKAEAGQAAKPEGEPQGERKGRRRARSGEEPADAAKPAEGEPRATSEHAPEGRKSKRLGKKGKPDAEEQPGEAGTETAKPNDTAKGEEKPAGEAAKPEAPKSETAKTEAPRETPAARPEPAPQVTSAPTPTPAAAASPAAPSPAPAVAQQAAPAPTPPSPPPAASAPAAPSGPPQPPISR
jgi:hypothetical protein